MELPFQLILTSPIFTFKVGEHGTEMRLPKALVSPSSPALEKLVDGEMIEAQTGVAELVDVDEATFVRYGKWLYTGAYDAPIVECGHERSASVKVEEDPLPWDFGLSPVARRKKEKMMKMTQTWEQRVQDDGFWAVGTNASGPPKTSSTKTKKETAWDAFLMEEIYRPVAPPRENVAGKYPELMEELLAHAKLYCFADKYRIVRLMEQCLERLKMALIDCECQSSQVADVAELIAFTVDNTRPLDAVEDNCLRAVVLSYAVIVFEVLCENETFQQMLEEGGSFVKEILSMLRKRLA